MTKLTRFHEHARRDERRAEAEERAAARAKRTPEQQLTALKARPGESRRERVRLSAQRTKR